MKKIILLVGLALAGVAAWYFWETKPKPDNERVHTPPAVASQHSAAFNQSADSLMQAYYAVSESLVNWDSATVDNRTAQLKNSLAALSLDELQKDATAHQTAVATLQTVRKEADEVAAAKSMEQKRRAFHALSQNLYSLLRTTQYDAKKVYLQECPMAFNDEETGNWLSPSADIRNPYLGMYHPKYKSGMLECGETKDSVGIAGTQ